VTTLRARWVTLSAPAPSSTSPSAPSVWGSLLAALGGGGGGGGGGDAAATATRLQATVQGILRQHAKALLASLHLQLLVSFTRGTGFDLAAFLAEERLAGGVRLPAFPTALTQVPPHRPLYAPRSAPCCMQRSNNSRIVTLGSFGWEMSLTRGRFATPADFPRHDGSPYSHVHA
jgi:hypothetical protein